MARNVTRFASRSFMRTVELNLIERLIQPYQAQLKIDCSELPADRDRRADAYFDLFHTAARDFPIQLIEALHSILRLSNANGMRVLVDEAEHGGIHLLPSGTLLSSGKAPPVTPRHLALLAYLDHRDLFDRALDLQAFLLPRAPLQVIGIDEKVTVEDDPEAQEAFRQAVSEYFRSRYQGEYCNVRFYPEADEFNVLVEHGMNLESILAEEHGSDQVLTFHEIRQDTLSYDPVAGRLKVNAETERDKIALKNCFARHLLRRPKFFDHESSQHLYTLEPVTRAGSRFTLNISRDQDLIDWAIVEIAVDLERPQGTARLRRMRSTVIVCNSVNAIAELAEIAPGLDLSAARISYLKLQLTYLLFGKKRRVVVTIKPPGVLRAPQGMLEPRILEVLRSNGLCLSRQPAAVVAEAA